MDISQEAAEKLFISQPSLSAAIHNLEKEMGVTIFVRSKKGVVLTREGEELLSYAGMLLEQVDIMKEHFGVGKAPYIKGFRLSGKVFHPFPNRKIEPRSSYRSLIVHYQNSPRHMPRGFAVK